MKIYGDLRSGNCLKVKWTADRLRMPYTWIPVDIMKGETRTPEFLAKFPMGQVPAVTLPCGNHLAQSNAIIRTMARDTPLLPADRLAQGRIDEWLFWEQYSHEPFIAVCRFHMLYQGKPKEAREAWRVERGEAALDLMERQIAGRSFFVGDALTIADIALLAYTRVAHEGGFDLTARPAIRTWVSACEKDLGL